MTISMDLASVVAALASVGVRVSGSTPNNNVQGDSSRACPTGLAGPEPSGTINDPGQHFHAAGTGMGSWCGAAIALCPLACVVGAVAAVAPQGCGSRVLMYTGLGQGGFGEVSLCFWSWLVRRLCGLCVWAVVTLFLRRAWLGVKG